MAGTIAAKGFILSLHFVITWLAKYMDLMTQKLILLAASSRIFGILMFEAGGGCSGCWTSILQKDIYT